jgi:hypothetical protein
MYKTIDQLIKLLKEYDTMCLFEDSNLITSLINHLYEWKTNPTLGGDENSKKAYDILKENPQNEISIISRDLLKNKYENEIVLYRSGEGSSKFGYSLDADVSLNFALQKNESIIKYVTYIDNVIFYDRIFELTKYSSLIQNSYYNTKYPIIMEDEIALLESPKYIDTFDIDIDWVEYYLDKGYPPKEAIDVLSDFVNKKTSYYK